MLYNNLYQILKNLSKDSSSIFANNDELIKKYIFNKNNCEKKRLNNILKEINYKDNIMPNFNYLYLLALNNFRELQKEDEITNDENEINTDIINKNKGNVINKDNNKIEEKKLIISKDKYEKIINKSINLTECEKVNDILKQKTENLIKREDLILTINSIEGNLLGLKPEEIKKYEDKYEEYIDRNFTYNRVLNLIDTNIYNILIFNEIIKQKEHKDIVNIDSAFIEYKNKFISLIEDINSIDYKMFYDIISDKKFHDEIITILKSESIKKYQN